MTGGGPDRPAGRHGARKVFRRLRDVLAAAR